MHISIYEGRGRGGLDNPLVYHPLSANPVSTEVWCHHFANFSIQTLKPHHETEIVAVRT